MAGTMASSGKVLLYCVLVLGCMVKVAQGVGRVQLRVDSFTVDRDNVIMDNCCSTSSCACETRMRACVYVRNGTACRDSEFETSPPLPGDFTIGRTPTLFDIEIDARSDNLALRIQMRYGRVGTLGSLINEYVIDMSSVQVGASEFEASWIAFTAGNGLNQASTDRLRVQVKIFCAEDYYGEQCGVLCQDVPGRYSCDPRTGQRQCVNHWLPPLCDVVDVCQRYPCLNGGSCHGRTDGGYTCTCNPNYTGTNCSLAVDSCASNPCERGVCHDQIDSYLCVCPPGYTGKNCQQPPNDCRAVPCQNNGQCLSNATSSSASQQIFQCRCPLGFYGVLCERDICQPSPCRHGGTCVRRGDSQWSCACPVGFTGATCDVPFPCASRPCRNQGQCLQTVDGDYRCNCPQPYTGRNCETLNACMSSPCANGGTCIPGVAAGVFRCRCLQGWSGATCQTRDPCASLPCGGNGRCTPNSSVPAGFVVGRVW